MINKPKLIFIYSTVLIYLIFIGLTHISPYFVPLVLISMGFILGFMANETFFREDKFTSRNKYPITEGDILANIRTSRASYRQMPSGPPPSLNKLNVGKELIKRLKSFNENIEENMNQSYTITTDNTQPIMNKPYKYQQNQKPCLHDSCPSCDGTGIRKDGLGTCIHMISCPCSKCTPYM